uniref:GH18 domain-containing protein n=1 Tax=Periophthalmus magnuspinnatus TaxID=409849 RepID=A0A3B4B3J2_9GOBI
MFSSFSDYIQTGVPLFQLVPVHNGIRKVYSGEHRPLPNLLDQEIPAQKLLLGFPAYARSYTLSTQVSSPGAPVSGLAYPGPFTQEMGFWSHYETCAFLHGASANWIDKQYVPYAVKNNQWVGFDNQQSYGAKVTYLMTQHLGGAAVWSLNLDDFTGHFCGQGKYPLISQLKAELSRVEWWTPAASTTSQWCTQTPVYAWTRQTGATKPNKTPPSLMSVPKENHM